MPVRHGTSPKAGLGRLASYETFLYGRLTEACVPAAPYAPRRSGEDAPATSGKEREMTTPERAVRYEIRVRGALDARWSAWFASLEVASDDRGETILSGSLPDQAALHGVPTRVRDLGLPLVAVRLAGPAPSDSPAEVTAPVRRDTPAWRIAGAQFSGPIPDVPPRQ